MDWLKTNYDKAALLAGALAALLCGTLVILGINSLPEAFANRDSSKPKDNTIKPPAVEKIEEASSVLAKPTNWSSHEGSLFVSRQYILKDGKLFDPIEGGEAIHPPIPNAWLIKYDLDFATMSIKEQDADNDGFSNLEEFEAGTDPTQKVSTPPFYTKLRLDKYIAIPFRLIFTGTPDEGQTFTINSKDLKSRTQFRQIGEMIEGSPYKIVKFEKKSEVRDEIERDISELTIENTETGQKLVLIVNKESNDPTSFAEFQYLLDGKNFKVKKDDTFELQPEKDRKYKLIDITEQEAVIQDVTSGEQFKIPKLK
jgi:hypothetical protein